MPSKWNMIFPEYLRILGTENTTGGGASTWPRGSKARPPLQGAPLPRGPMVAPLHLFLHPCSSSSSPKNPYPAQAWVLAHFGAIFDLLAQSSIHKTALGDCSLVCAPPMVQLVFVLVLYSLQIFAAKVTLFLSLHVKFNWSQVVLMHDIVSRHLWE